LPVFYSVMHAPVRACESEGEAKTMRFGIGMAAAVLAAAVAGGGCEDAIVALEASSQQLGVLQYEGAALNAPGLADPGRAIRWSVEPTDDVAFVPAAIEAPDTVEAGKAFTVGVNTIGPNGCWRAAGMDATRAGRIVELRPWDEHSGAEVCTLVLGILRHETRLTLDEKGEWTLRARGRLVRQGGLPDGQVTAERTVVVR
jgi:hypothetical protein